MQQALGNGGLIMMRADSGIAIDVLVDKNLAREEAAPITARSASRATMPSLRSGLISCSAETCGKAGTVERPWIADWVGVGSGAELAPRTDSNSPDSPWG